MNATWTVPADGRRVPRVLVLISHYLPGLRAGGPISSIVGFVDNLGDEFDIRVVCLDRDMGDRVPYPRISTDESTQRGKAQVRYLRQDGFSLRGIKTLLRQESPSVLYLNSVFSVRFTVLPILAARMVRPRPRIVLAARGSLSDGAMAIRNRKKALFLSIIRRAGLFRDITWQASTPAEGDDIRGRVGQGAAVCVAGNLTPLRAASVDSPARPKARGALKVIFLSRISPKKNLLFAIRLLGRVPGEVDFTVAGPVGDPAYWIKCQEEINRLPLSVRVQHVGAVPRDRVVDCLAGHHVLLLPTLSENFGHVIVESLAAGTPVLISDQTPWHDLEEAGAGWAFPLAETDRFVAVLQRLVGLDAEEFAELSRNARTLAAAWHGDDSALRANRELFTSLVRIADDPSWTVTPRG